jgi:hypothetical protein
MLRTRPPCVACNRAHTSSVGLVVLSPTIKSTSPISNPGSASRTSTVCASESVSSIVGIKTDSNAERVTRYAYSDQCPTQCSAAKWRQDPPTAFAENPSPRAHEPAKG